MEKHYANPSTYPDNDTVKDKDTNRKMTEFIWEIGHDRQLRKAMSNSSTTNKDKNKGTDTNRKITKFIWELGQRRGEQRQVLQYLGANTPYFEFHFQRDIKHRTNISYICFEKEKYLSNSNHFTQNLFLF